MNFESLQKYALLTVVIHLCFGCDRIDTNESNLSAYPELSNQDSLLESLEDEPNKSKDIDTLEQRLINLGLVDVQEINPKIRVDLKYCTNDNFMRTNVYGKLRRAYLQKEVAEKLSNAQDYLSEKDSNLFLLVYDAVRPRWVQYKMWNSLDSIPVGQRTKFVSNPRNGSVHNYGAAVDLTICYSNGIPLDMGAFFDDPREIAYPSKEQYFFCKRYAFERANNKPPTSSRCDEIGGIL